MSLDFDSLSLTEIIQLQNQLSAHLTRRFEKHVALVFSDVIGSTHFFRRFGDEAGHRMQQQHVDLIREALVGSDGQIFHIAGDGVFLMFAHVESAVASITRSHQALCQLHLTLTEDKRWLMRSCIHWGPVLTDGRIVAGDAANLCAKLAGTIKAQEILLTKQALTELPARFRALSRPLAPVHIPGVAEPFEVFHLPWDHADGTPAWIVIQETGQRIPIPKKNLISCGRLQESNGAPANDIVLTLPDPLLNQRISRWHVELRREGNRLYLKSVTDQPTELNGVELRRGEQVAVESGATVRLSNVMTLRLEPDEAPSQNQDLTLPYQRVRS